MIYLIVKWKKCGRFLQLRAPPYTYPWNTNLYCSGLCRNVLHADLSSLRDSARLSKGGHEGDCVFWVQVKGPTRGTGNRRSQIVSKRRTYELWKGTLNRYCSWIALSRNPSETVEDQPSMRHYVQPGVMAKRHLVRTAEVALHVTQNKGWLKILGSSPLVVRLKWH